MLKSIALRMKEPSSWAGVAAVVAGLGLSVDPGLLQSGILVASGLCGIAAVFLPEAGK